MRMITDKCHIWNDDMRQICKYYAWGEGVFCLIYILGNTWSTSSCVCPTIRKKPFIFLKTPFSTKLTIKANKYLNCKRYFKVQLKKKRRINL